MWADPPLPSGKKGVSSAYHAGAYLGTMDLEPINKGSIGLHASTLYGPSDKQSIQVQLSAFEAFPGYHTVATISGLLIQRIWK